MLPTATAPARRASKVTTEGGVSRGPSPKLCPQTRIEWFHQYRNKEARVLSNATEVAARIRMPEDWHRRWSEFYGDVVSFRRLFRSNRRDDAPDVLTGIVETESAGPGKCIRAVGFSG